LRVQVPRFIDLTLKNLGYDMTDYYQRDMLEALRADLETFSEAPNVEDAVEILRKEIKAIDTRGEKHETRNDRAV
jgi:hypothetical protein